MLAASRAGLVVLGLLATLAGCSASSSGQGCGPERREALDPGYTQHVLPGPSAAKAKYLTDPPTSGPHQPAPPISGVSPRPISKPVQVGLLEAGKVLVQYRDLKAPDVTRLQALAGSNVVVAPAAELPGGERVVATAWTFKRSCGTLDSASLKRFVTDHAGHGPNQF